MTMARRGYGCRTGTPVVRGTGVDLAQPGQGSYAPARAVGTVRLNRFREQMFEHDAKRATQPISVNPARVSECQDRRKTAPSAVSKKPRRFPSLAARFFTICLNSKKSRQVLTRRARATQLRIGCVARLNGTFHFYQRQSGVHYAGGCGAAARLRCAIKRHLPLPNGKRHTPCRRGRCSSEVSQGIQGSSGNPEPERWANVGGMGETPKSGGTSLRCRRQRKRAL